MTQPDQIDMNWPCRRCGHIYGQHAVGDAVVRCEAELSPGRVPSFESGGVCPCPEFVYEPASEPTPEPEQSELLDGPLMYAEGLGYMRLARTASSSLVELDSLRKAGIYFAGATAAALAAIVVDNGTGDITERRWLAALAGEDVLPEDAQA